MQRRCESTSCAAISAGFRRAALRLVRHSSDFRTLRTRVAEARIRLARADALHVEVTGMPRMLLAQAIEQFRISLDHQEDAMIATAREEPAEACRGRHRPGRDRSRISVAAGPEKVSERPH
jgi:hypothetical protein